MERPWLRASLTTVGCGALTLALNLLSADLARASSEVPGEEQAIQLEETIVPAELLPLPDAQQVRHSRTLARDMKLMRERQKAELAKLTALFLAEKNPAQSIELQKQIQALKLEGQLEIFELQLRHARELGMDEIAKEAESNLRDMRDAIEAKSKNKNPQDGQS